MSNSRWKLITLSDALAHPKFNGFGPEFCAMKNMIEVFFENLDIKLDIVQDSQNVWNVLDKNETKTEIFNFAKTQWLINDINYTGAASYHKHLVCIAKEKTILLLMHTWHF